MSKNNKTMNKTVDEIPLANFHGKTVEELKEVVQTLQAQLKEHQRLGNHHQIMATKAKGALEVMLQLIPKEEVEKMVAQESQESRENGELVEG